MKRHRRGWWWRYLDVKRLLLGINFPLNGYEALSTALVVAMPGFEAPSTALVVAMPGYEAPSTGHEFSVHGL